MKKLQTKDFDAVSFMRQQRNKISKKLFNMSNEEVLKYLEKIGSENALPVKRPSQSGL